MEYRIIRQRTRQHYNTQFIKQLTEQFSLTPLCAQYLMQKGINTTDEAEEFLHPGRKYLNDPFLFNDMQRAVDRINLAIEHKEKIVIYADYDCDGICAAVILYKALTEKTKNVECFLPDRFTDGYGMNLERVKELAENKASLIITLDNGITAVEEIKLANEYGIDVILTDHHEPTQQIPDAYAVIDPKIPSEKYPFKELCGSGVALKLATAIGIKDNNLLDELTVFAAIATVADLVPLTEENRTIVSLGISNLKKKPNEGLAELIKLAGLDTKNISSGNISFQIAPRINASGRMANANLAFEVFTSKDSARIKADSKALNEQNEQRKATETDIERQCEEIIEATDITERQPVLFIALENAHEGVIGIAAGKISEKYHRPCIVGNVKDGKVTASARSILGFNIFEALCAGEEYYIKFGGHEQAAGFTIARENFDALSEAVNKKAEAMGIAASLYKTTLYDIEAQSSLITKKAVEQLELFAPYGIKNPKSVFKIENVQIKNLTYMGANCEHVRCSLMSKNDNLSAIAFFGAKLFSGLDFDEDTYDVLFTPSFNTFNGLTRIQAEIKDLCKHIDCPEDYFESLYKHFYANANVSVDYVPDKSAFSRYSAEGALENKNGLFILYGKDMLVRVMRYAAYTGCEVNISYSSVNGFKEGQINVLVNPICANLEEISREIIVLDEPCFCGYESRLYKNKSGVSFLKGTRFVPALYIDRDYIAFIYKKLRMLEYLDNDYEEFMRFLNKESEMEINYFTLRISFDIMNEMNIIDYEIIKDKIFVEFKPVRGSIDINASTVMTKLAKFNL